MGWDETRAREQARADHGLVDRGTLIEMGATDAVIRRRIQHGRWERIHGGVYYLNVTPASWRIRLRAAVLGAGPHALASHRAAAALWELEGVRGEVVELTVPYSKLPDPEGAVVHRTRRLLPSAVVDSIPVTSVERTILDLASMLPDPVVEKCVTSALGQRLTTLDQIGAVVAEMGGRGVRGTRRVRRVLDAVEDGLTGSPAEVEAMRLIRSAPIPQPICQYPIRFPDGSHAYPDFAWPGLGRCIEVDGFGAHSSPEALEADLIRQNKLLARGWELRRFSARQIRRDPQGVLAQIVDFIRGVL